MVYYANAPWRVQAPTSFRVGQFALLPRIPYEDHNSAIINQLQHVNDEMCGHPLLVIGTIDKGTTVTVLQMTSFGGKNIREKYPSNSDNSRAMRNQYLAIDHRDTVRHSSLPVLRLANSAKMTKQSYVNLDQFFTIEASYLQPWAKDKNQLERQLDAPSIEAVEQAFLAVISCATQRRTSNPINISSPLDYRDPKELTARYLGVKDTRFVKPPRKNSAVTIVAPPSPPLTPTPPSTPPTKPPPKFPLQVRANGAQLFQTSKIGMIGK